jgi:hypothetical protein
LVQEKYQGEEFCDIDHYKNNKNIIIIITYYTISACPTFAKEHYIEAHNRVCVLNYTLKYAGNTGKIRQLPLVQACVKISRNESEGKVTTLENQQVQTSRAIPNSKPEFITRDDEKGTCVLADVAISGDSACEM